jgi:hypothetical protein
MRQLPVDLSRVTPVDRMKGEDSTETAALVHMLGRAETYIQSFRWCPPIADRFLGIGIGGIFALFLFRFQAPIGLTDEWLWIVEGDLPSAYFVVDDAPEPAGAVEAYCKLMEEWEQAVATSAPLDKVFPIPVAATKENADALRSRIKFIRENIIPMCKQ